MSTHSPHSMQPQSGRRPDRYSQASHATGLADTELSELSQGLLAPQASVSPKYLYDTLGSKLFEALCLLPEYYPTRTEAAIFEARRSEIAQAVPRQAVLIDLGAGNCAKAETLFEPLRPSHYIAVDISADFVRSALRRLRPRHPGIRMQALGQDFSRGLELGDDVPSRGRLFFYPGSSLGNFAPPEARRFLRGLKESTADAASLLLGVDLVKDIEILQAAYDDALGVTSAFNLNVLRNINRILGTDFDMRHWQHIALFNPTHSRVEMHLQARHDVLVSWNGHSRRFSQGERIHTENSYKYTREGLAKLLEESGWTAGEFWTDEAEWFAVVHARSESTHP